MIVVISPRVATVQGADDCNRLHVSTALAGSALDEELRARGLGRLVHVGDVELDTDALRMLARAAASASDWDEKWERMIAFADRSGWMSEDGRRVRVHVESQP